MSDGPHKSLPMSRSWKRVAERASLPAYSASDVEDAVSAALISDFAGAPVDEVREAFIGDMQASLFSGSRVEALQAFRQSAPDPVMGPLIDGAVAAARAGSSSEQEFQRLVCEAVSERFQRRVRQIEGALPSRRS